MERNLQYCVVKKALMHVISFPCLLSGNIIKATILKETCFISDSGITEEPRVLGLVMVPGKHIVSIHLDDTTSCGGETT